MARNYALSILRRAGHIVVGVAENGKIAIELCREHKPDAVILDISMPVLTGLEAARTIVQEKLCAYVFIASSNMQGGAIGQATALGCGIIGKPFEDVQLLSGIAKRIPGFRAVRGT